MAVSTSNSPQTILQQIAEIKTMERGKLSIIREGPSGPFYKIQAREDGKNVTRYVPRDQVTVTEEAIEGYKHFQKLTEQYAELKIQETRAAIAADSKKNRTLRSSSPRIRKSGS